MTPTIELIHVAGPPEREQRDDGRPGWRWAQRCLRCDALLNLRSTSTDEEQRAIGRALADAEPGEFVRVDLSAPGGFFKLGTTVYELEDGIMTSEPAPRTSSAPTACPSR